MPLLTRLVCSLQRDPRQDTERQPDRGDDRAGALTPPPSHCRLPTNSKPAPSIYRARAGGALCREGYGRDTLWMSTEAHSFIGMLP